MNISTIYIFISNAIIGGARGIFLLMIVFLGAYTKAEVTMEYVMSDGETDSVTVFYVSGNEKLKSGNTLYIAEGTSISGVADIYQANVVSDKQKKNKSYPYHQRKFSERKVKIAAKKNAPVKIHRGNTKIPGAQRITVPLENNSFVSGWYRPGSGIPVTSSYDSFFEISSSSGSGNPFSYDEAKVQVGVLLYCYSVKIWLFYFSRPPPVFNV